MWEYIAGFFDGEGNLQFWSNKNKNKNKNKYYRARISNSEIIVLEEIKTFLGFGRIRINVKSKKSTRRDNYILEIAKKKNLIFFLEGILPYLILKRKKAEKALEFLR